MIHASSSQIIWQTYVLNSQFLGLVTSATLAVILTFLIGYLREKRAETKERKNFATLLGYEVAAINHLAVRSIRSATAVLESVKSGLKDHDLRVLFFEEPDFSRVIYERPSFNIALFGLDLSAKMSELYRWVDFANHAKALANNYCERALQIISKSRPNLKLELGDESVAEKWLSQFTVSGDEYSRDLERIRDLSSQVLIELKRIIPIDETKTKVDSMAPEP